MKVSVRRYPNGFAVFAGRHRWDYWGRAGWLPLSIRRSRAHWWGYITHQRYTPESEGTR